MKKKKKSKEREKLWSQAINKNSRIYMKTHTIYIETHTLKSRERETH